ncbi:putative ankyrin repeat protein RF_0381 [Lolium rigidum]|uniref:putative ankyrin repeat protein RF_0381 n=1 Tax=Lolium rigidum TaxID=89674 RepID=UPI001F5CB795|nr:putative ankyrin repeat protein RF_0381 [Lolium rigidum]
MDYIWHEMQDCSFLRKLPQYASYIMRLICLKWAEANRGDLLEQCYPITIHKERNPNVKHHSQPRYGKNAPKEKEEEEADSDDSDFVPNSVKTKGLFAKLVARLNNSLNFGPLKFFLTKFITPDADVDLATDAGRTALHYTASKGRRAIDETLIARRANVNKKDKFGCTPLHRAASTGNADMCEGLIEEGADIDAVDKTGQSPLMHAVICEDRGVALLLIRHGADVDIEDKEGYTALGRASDSFRPALIDAAKAMLEG